mgnify:CR=1 FL=1
MAHANFLYTNDYEDSLRRVFLCVNFVTLTYNGRLHREFLGTSTGYKPVGYEN